MAFRDLVRGWKHKAPHGFLKLDDLEILVTMSQPYPYETTDEETDNEEEKWVGTSAHLHMYRISEVGYNGDIAPENTDGEEIYWMVGYT